MPDYQRITKMHYYTYSKFRHLVQAAGLDVLDMREAKIARILGPGLGLIAVILFRVIFRPVYVSTFHLLLCKN